MADDDWGWWAENVKPVTLTVELWKRASEVCYPSQAEIDAQDELDRRLLRYCNGEITWQEAWGLTARNG